MRPNIEAALHGPRVLLIEDGLHLPLRTLPHAGMIAPCRVCAIPKRRGTLLLLLMLMLGVLRVRLLVGRWLMLVLLLVHRVLLLLLWLMLLELLLRSNVAVVRDVVCLLHVSEEELACHAKHSNRQKEADSKL